MKRLLAFLLSFLLGAGSALAQSGETINQLSAGAALQGTEQIPMYQGSNPAVTTTPSAVAAYAVGSPRSGLNGWVNIRDPAFGATGNGATDDTAAIQAAIDYAFAHNLTAVYCPAGNYKTSSTIYLDPPGNLRSNLTSPTMFSFTMAFFGDPTGGGQHVGGCQLSTTFNNAVAFMVGTGQSMRISDISVVGPANAYRGNLNPGGIGIGLTGGNGGSSSNLVENTYVANFYALYETDANNACCLSDQNTFRKVGGTNAYYGVFLNGTQSYINDIVEPNLQNTTVAVDSTYAHQVDVRGGFLSAGAGQSSSFGLTINDFTGSGCTVPGGRCIDATIAAPDIYVGKVYNSYVVNTPHFGLIPLTMVSWNSGTNAAVFQYWGPWLYENYGRSNNFQFQTELQAATTIYAVERVFVAQGLGVDMYGVHIENPSACTTLLYPKNVWAAQTSNKIVDPFFNYDISAPPTTTANKYCQQVFPFIGGDIEGFSYDGNYSKSQSLDISGGNWNVQTLPVIIDITPWFKIRGKHLFSAEFNLRLFDQQGCAYGQISVPSGSGGGGTSYCGTNASFQFGTAARGSGRWDYNYFLPSALTGLQDEGDQSAEFCGYEPCPWTSPNLSPSLYALVSGSLGALGSYVPVACRTVFKSVDWNSATLTHIHLRSASCPGYSWGQNLN
ncbi:MAG: glycosyl hydrolase family 28-related protein, partial [Xanthobacteraceae bacterium]